MGIIQVSTPSSISESLFWTPKLVTLLTSFCWKIRLIQLICLLGWEENSMMLKITFKMSILLATFHRETNFVYHVIFFLIIWIFIFLLIEWAERYTALIDRFSHIIRGQFFGHTHLDHFESFHSYLDNSLIGTVFIAPSLTT